MLQKRHMTSWWGTKPLTQRGIFNSLAVENQCVCTLREVGVVARRLGFIGLLATTFGLIQGCASTAHQAEKVASAPSAVESKVSKRAEARWAALIKHDLTQAYEFLSPGSKAANPLDLYKSKVRPLQWRSASVLAARCDSARCDVQLKLILDIKAQSGVETVISEVWVRDGGEWWYVFTG